MFISRKRELLNVRSKEKSAKRRLNSDSSSISSIAGSDRLPSTAKAQSESLARNATQNDATSGRDCRPRHLRLPLTNRRCLAAHPVG